MILKDPSLLFGHIAHFDLLKDVSISFFLSFFLSFFVKAYNVPLFKLGWQITLYSWSLNLT